MLTFKETGIEENIIRAVEELGFERTMPVQEKVIPLLIKDDSQDIIALAQTGTGKTAAFGLPGRFIMSTFPFIPATPLDNIA